MDKPTELEFSNKELQDKYYIAKRISEDHLKKLDMFGVDVRRMEDFLQKSGFGEFEKTYGYIQLNFDGKRLRLGGTNLLETKVRLRLESYPFLSDFLASIALFHLHLGDKNESN